jgi:hypothetical protein
MEWLMTTLGAICLLAPLKEHSGRQNILLADSNKQTVNPESGHQPSPWPIGARSFWLHSSQARPSRTPGTGWCGSSGCHPTSWEREPPSSLLDWGGIWIADGVAMLRLRTERHEACSSPWEIVALAANWSNTRRKALFLECTPFSGDDRWRICGQCVRSVRP